MTDTAVDPFLEMSNCLDNYILVDVGANLTSRKFSRDLESVISRAKDSGVQKIIVCSQTIKGSKEAMRLSQIFPGMIYSMAGVYPHEAKSWEPETLGELREIAKNTECVAIGQCGLDYCKNFSTPEVQRDVFRAQVELACQLKKPLCIHERDAFDDAMSILNEFKAELPPVVLLSYTGPSSNVQKYIDMGIYLGITGYITKDNSGEGVQALLDKGTLPMEQLLVQSDAPFMYPNARASKLPDHVKGGLTERSTNYLQRYCTFTRNEPCSLPIIVEILAAFMKKSPEDIALATAFNALKIFGLS
ncbi:unnamed protein product [Nesidiocoris tenuis]|uniref:TatD related DNase n=2 Tax=Nesidiocoris tenuis TaxID=355587 RepID=A0ABN7AJ36_9HEMI|nr:TatD related DNase [Nesidiocoris tenuis]CAB0009518.1 unnamed protein product [Nesidiocoris tenuis]